jgi:hypothetical protein
MDRNLLRLDFHNVVTVGIAFGIIYAFFTFLHAVFFGSLVGGTAATDEGA